MWLHLYNWTKLDHQPTVIQIRNILSDITNILLCDLVYGHHEYSRCYSGQEGKRKNQLLSGVKLTHSDWDCSALCTEPQLPELVFPSPLKFMLYAQYSIPLANITIQFMHNHTLKYRTYVILGVFWIVINI